MSSQRRSPAKNQPRHSKDDALESREYQFLLEGCYQLDDDYFSLEARLVVLLTGRLGMRVGELIHLQEDWIDWRDRMIRIPDYHPCSKGKDGGICGHCRQLAQQQVKHNDDLDLEEALRHRWQPKTDAAARSIPFDHDARVEIAIEQYFDKYDEFQGSHSVAHRRITRAAEQIDELDEDSIYPHALRATAASYLASQGIDTIALQSMLGWSQLSTAQRYVRRSGDRTRKALQAAHSR